MNTKKEKELLSLIAQYQREQELTQKMFVRILAMLKAGVSKEKIINFLEKTILGLDYYSESHDN